jgi:hypothetical protein
MDIAEFRKVLASFADEPTDVDVRLGKVVAQIRDDLIDVDISYSHNDERGLVVAENGHVFPARTWLLNRVAKIPQLADRIISSTEPKPDQTRKSPFVTPSGTLSRDITSADTDESDEFVADALDALIQRATKQQPGATSVLYLTSDAGEGKTTIINRAAWLQARRYKEKLTTSLIVPIPLSGRLFLTFDDAVIAALVNRLRFPYFYFDAFLHLVRLGAVVPAFDGYEEMLVEGAKREAVGALGSLVQSLDSSGTVIIAARKAFFEYLSFRTQAKLLDAIGDRYASFSRLALSRWSREQFCEFGKRRGCETPEKVYEMVAARLGSGHPMLTRAVLVRRLFDVVEDTADLDRLLKLLGSNPHDYFFTFVDAIVQREAVEKWLFQVSGEVSEPLLTIEEHHEILSLIAQEMWQTSANSVRHDVLDVIVDIFSESHRKSAGSVRQIKERLKQHSLLATEESRGQAIMFDHDDFQFFYLGEALGQLLSRSAITDNQAFLSVNLVSSATVDQSVQYLIRHKAALEPVLRMLAEISRLETGFSFCRENCGALAIRLAEAIGPQQQSITLDSMLFPANSLSGRTLESIVFIRCHFQPISLVQSRLQNVRFQDCEFERVELEFQGALSGASFSQCRIESVVVPSTEDQTFDPDEIPAWLTRAGATIDQSTSTASNRTSKTRLDDRVVVLERFLRVFLRSTYADEDSIRIRLGKSSASKFFDEVLPSLLGNRLLEEVTWKGKGVQRRFKLAVPLSHLNSALERSHGDFDEFLNLAR